MNSTHLTHWENNALKIRCVLLHFIILHYFPALALVIDQFSVCLTAQRHHLLWKEWRRTLVPRGTWSAWCKIDIKTSFMSDVDFLCKHLKRSDAVRTHKGISSACVMGRLFFSFLTVWRLYLILRDLQMYSIYIRKCVPVINLSWQHIYDQFSTT